MDNPNDTKKDEPQTGSENGNTQEVNLEELSKEDLIKRYNETSSQYKASSTVWRVNNEVIKVYDSLANDWKYFSELQSKNPSMAEKVVEDISKRRNWTKEETIEALLSSDDWSNKDADKEPNEEEKFKAYLDKEKANDYKTSFITKLGLKEDDEVYNAFIGEYNSLMEGKKPTLANIKKCSNAAYKLIKGDKIDAFKKTRNLADISSINASWSAEPKKSEPKHSESYLKWEQDNTAGGSW